MIKVFAINFDTAFGHLDKPDANGFKVNDILLILKDNKVETIDEIRGLMWTDCMTPFGATKRVYEEILDYPRLQ